MKDVSKRRQHIKKMFFMIRKNERTEAQIILGMGYLKKSHLTSDDVVFCCPFFGAVAATTKIVWKHTLPLNL